MATLPGALLRGIQDGDEAMQMAELDDKWEFVDLGDVMSGMAAAMAEADALEPTYEEAQWQSDWPEWSYVVKLLKTLHGLKQAGKKWYDSLCHLLADIGLKKSEANPTCMWAMT